MAKVEHNERCKDCIFFHGSAAEGNRFGMCVFQCRITYSEYGTPECGFEPRVGPMVNINKLRELLTS